MNLVLLFDDDFVNDRQVRLTGRRLDHIRNVHRASSGDDLVVGLAGGKIGTGRVLEAGPEAVDIEVNLDREPPAPSPITLVLALPRPKVLNRVIASASSMGVKRIYLINSWRVEKSYWKSPRLSESNLREQAILGLEQARDTIFPAIEMRRLFRPFVEGELPALIGSSMALVAHPYAAEECPRNVASPVTLAIGPEGGFIAAEIESLTRAGFRPVTIGERILRVETALAYVLGRL